MSICQLSFHTVHDENIAIRELLKMSVLSESRENGVSVAINAYTGVDILMIRFIITP